MAGLRTASRPGLAGLWDRALDVVFPPRCVACKAFGAFICELCYSSMAAADGMRCPVCWSPSARESACEDCRRHRPAFSGTRAAFRYEGVVRDAVHAFKFKGVSALAPLLANQMAACLGDWSPPVDVIAPVPLAGARCRTRGYNQSELLAREVSRLSGFPLDSRLLVRVHAGAPQARQVGEGSRWRNVVGAFAVRKAAPPGVLLIDDVITTGATLDACARVLLEKGAANVYALTFARED